MGLLWSLFIGFVIGLVARYLKPGNDGMGIILTTVLGVVGAVVAGFIGQVMGIYAPDEPVGFIASVLGAILVLYVVQALRKKSA